MNTSHAPVISQRWITDCNMVMQGSAVAADLNGDGNAGFLTAAYQSLIALNGAGKELWRFSTNRRYMTCPAVLERPGETALIYAGDVSHDPATFSCVDGNGQVVWQAEMGQVFWSSPALGDINNDGRIEVVQGDALGGVHVYDALTGKLLWEITIDGVCGSPAIGDINGDGMLEIVIATSTGKLYTLSAAGEILNETRLGGTIFDPVGEYAGYRICSPVIFATSSGEIRIATSVQEADSRRFLCLNTDSDVLWEHPTDGGVATTISVADFNGDGRVDIFAPSQNGRLYRWDEDGRVLWDIDTQGFCYAPGAIVDLDGDGNLEYALCTELGLILMFDQEGDIVYSHQLGSRRAHRSTPAFGKTAEGGLAFAITGGDAGQMYCFDVPGRADAQVEWGAYRGDNNATGAVLRSAATEVIRMVPENIVWDSILTTDEITFRITNPTPGETPLQAEAAMVAPDGTKHGAVGTVFSGSGILKMLVSITTPGIHRFEWMVTDSSGAMLTTGNRGVLLAPFTADQALVQRTLFSIQNALDGADVTVPRSNILSLLDRELQAIEQDASELAPLQTAVPGSDLAFAAKVTTRTQVLSVRAKRAMSLAGIASELLTSAPEAVLVPFQGRTWENRDVETELPTKVAVPLKIDRRCVTGEHEPVSIKLLNVTPGIAMVNTVVETTVSGLAVTPHEVKVVPTNPDQGITAWDPISPLDDADSIEIPSFETREVWLDIDATQAPAGEHHITIRFQTDSIETRVEIKLEVLPFEMTGYDQMRLCAWARYSPEAVQDLLAHGNTVFTTGIPPATAHQDGDSVQIEVDFTDIDNFVAPMMGHDVYLLLTGVPELGIDSEEDAYTPRLADYFQQVMSHLTAKGIPKDRVALYPWDEVGGHGWDVVRRFVRFGRKAHTAYPGINIYVNGGGDLPMFEELAEIATIWSPAFFMLDDKTPVMDFLRNSDAALWTYNCSYMYARPLGWNTKAINVVAEFRMQAVFATNYGATGIGYWCYNAGPNMWDAVDAEYPIVYQADPDGPITASRRWEAVRESVEDARILMTLRAMLVDGSVQDSAKAKIQHLIDVTVPAMADKSLAEMHLGTARYVLDDTNNDEMVETFRRELLDCVAAVIG
jgi:outer membrane protein assembly factor BamB